MFYLILLAPVGAMALLVAMSSLERWHQSDRRGAPETGAPREPLLAADHDGVS